ncbi:MAG: hypothetical protein E7658_02010 [Ruminococcaceae bacterium]|nr:hypothetical protein [Oscillospiraceae bacterium]
MTESKRIALLEPPQGKISMVLDTDAGCEVDDQFAIAYAVRAAQAGELDLLGIYAEISIAAYNPVEKKDGPIAPADGMEKNYQEILKVLDLIHSPEYKDIAFRGCKSSFSKDKPELSPAAEHLIRTAMDETREGPLYVVAIGPSTNIASAIAAAPEIMERIVVVWLAGNSLHYPHVYECNFLQDTVAGAYIFDCGVPMTLLPAFHVITGLSTTIPELEHYMGGKNEFCEYMLNLVRDYHESHKVPGEAWSKVIWDIAGIAYVLHPEWFVTRLVPTPIIGSNWSSDPLRPYMRLCDFVVRDSVFTDMFAKITK